MKRIGVAVLLTLGLIITGAYAHASASWPSHDGFGYVAVHCGHVSEDSMAVLHVVHYRPHGTSVYRCRKGF